MLFFHSATMTATHIAHEDSRRMRKRKFSSTFETGPVSDRVKRLKSHAWATRPQIPQQGLGKIVPTTDLPAQPGSKPFGPEEDSKKRPSHYRPRAKGLRLGTPISDDDDSDDDDDVDSKGRPKRPQDRPDKHAPPATGAGAEAAPISSQPPGPETFTILLDPLRTVPRRHPRSKTVRTTAYIDSRNLAGPLISLSFVQRALGLLPELDVDEGQAHDMMLLAAIPPPPLPAASDDHHHRGAATRMGRDAVAVAGGDDDDNEVIEKTERTPVGRTLGTVELDYRLKEGWGRFGRVFHVWDGRCSAGGETGRARSRGRWDFWKRVEADVCFPASDEDGGVRTGQSRLSGWILW